MSAAICTLNPIALQACSQFLTAFPQSVITSARRTLPEQCLAMTLNIIRNPYWVRLTYVPSVVSVAVQHWVDGLTQGAGPARIAAGLLAVLEGFPPADLRALSWHLSGDAFDVQSTVDIGQVEYLQALVAQRIRDGGHGKMLSKEGGLVRWHIQID